MNLNGLNEPQKRAVKQIEGPLLIIAGAGSGKTRVLTNRIAYMIGECGISPTNILAITFTNKAAREMRERVNQTVGDFAGEVWVSTFHSTCVRILRRYIDRIGYSTNFTIYDTDDQKSLMKDICKKMNIDTKMLKECSILSVISKAKDELTSPDEMELNAGNDYNMKRIAGIYREYQKALKLNNALDFDDLIYKTVELFEKDEEVLDYYQEKFQYICVDEYQDTNTSQFRLISMLAGKYGNLCVVGDDDQSIYKFRGANIGNILNFEHEFPGAKVIKLEQNYRSTQTILNAANAVIKNNIGRKSKALWTENGDGEKIKFAMYETAYDEAQGIADGISAYVRDGWNYNDIAILYRTNAQSRVLEEKLMMKNIPYRIYGGLNFYQRKEIKDIIAYLKTIDNGSDGMAVKRIINVPKRGIGDTTIARVQEYADFNDITFWEALADAENIDSIKRGASKIEPFVKLIESFKSRKDDMTLQELVESVIEETHYLEALLENETKEEVEAREENLDEFINKVVSYEETCEANGEEATLSGLLEEVALIADIDNLNESDKQVMLMTLHSAKGLEFPIVYMAGMEDGLFPSYMTIVSDDPTEVEEERRLAYVGITRAKKELILSSAKLRMVRGEPQINKVSRFVKEIPEEYLSIENNCQGYNNRKIAFGGSDESLQDGAVNIRANAKATLNRYSSGSAANPSSIAGRGNGGSFKGVGYGKTFERTRIDGNSGSTGRYSSNPYASRPSFATNTNYGTKNSINGAKNVYSAGTSSNTSNPSANPGFGKAFPMDLFNLKKSDNANSLGYSEGDNVEHARFGRGVVKVIENAPRDYMVTVDFEEFGTKKMLAGFAKLKKV
ncbi:MAG: ATP-dependent helicase [Lachnospira sp.]